MKISQYQNSSSDITKNHEHQEDRGGEGGGGNQVNI